MNTKTHHWKRGSLLVSVALLAAATGITASAADPIAGTWILDVAQSNYKPGPAPLGQVRIYEPLGEEGMRVKVNTAYTDGTNGVAEYVNYADGRDYPVTGDSAADAVSMVKVDDYVSQATLKHGNKVIGLVIREISEDGKTMKMTYSGYQTWKGFEEKVTNVAVYTKQ